MRTEPKARAWRVALIAHDGKKNEMVLLAREEVEEEILIQEKHHQLSHCPLLIPVLQLLELNRNQQEELLLRRCKKLKEAYLQGRHKILK